MGNTMVVVIVVMMVMIVVMMVVVIVVMMVLMVQVVVTVVSGVTMSPLDCCCPDERRETRVCIETDSYYDPSFTPSCPSDCHEPARLQVLYISVESQYSH